MIADLQLPEPSTHCIPVADALHPRCAARPPFAFAVPAEERDEFHTTVLAHEQLHVERLLKVLADIHRRWPAVRRGCAYHARALQVAKVRGWTAKSILTAYYTYTSTGKDGLAAGNWRVLVRYQKQSGTGLSGRPAFIRLFKLLVDQHQRVVVSAIRDLEHLYRTGYTLRGERVDGLLHGVSFPGYEDWPEADPRTGVPAGWTENNLCRHAPDRYERAAARQGVKAASQVGLKGRFTREGLVPGQQVSGDDCHHDVNVLVPGERTWMRPRCLGLQDVCSGEPVALVTKTTHWDGELEQIRALNERDTMWFVIAYLMSTGYRQDTGTEFLIELGTFRIPGDKLGRPIDHPDRDDLQARIWRVTGGKVTFRTSGRFNEAAHGGQFAPPSGGNFRFKPIEEFWKCLHNRLDHLPGQAGMDRNHAPESMEREGAYVAQLLKLATGAGVERAARLQFPVLRIDQFTQQVADALNAYSNAQAHALKGWEKCGFIIEEWFDVLLQRWLTREQMGARAGEVNEAQAREIMTAIQSNVDFIRTRRMTRREAWLSGRAKREVWQRIPASALAVLVGVRNAMNGGKPKPVQGGEFVFDHDEIDSDPVAFFAVDKDGQRLAEGSKWVCYVNPLQPDVCAIYDAGGRFVNACPRHIEASRADPSACVREAGQVIQWNRNALADMRERNTDEAAKLDFMRRHNKAVLAGKPVTAEEKASERRVQRNRDRFGTEAGEEVLAAVSGQQSAVSEEIQTGAADEVLAAL